MKNELLKKTIVFKNENETFSIFRRRYHNEAIVFLKNENVNIPTYTTINSTNLLNPLIYHIIFNPIQYSFIQIHTIIIPFSVCILSMSSTIMF